MTIHHTAGNIKKWVVDYKRWLLPGEAISTQSVVSSSQTLTVTNTSINLHKEVWFYLNSGVAGETPTVTVTVTTSKGKTKIDVFDALVTSP